jgi:SAM-dependent methyltransferase
MLLSAPSAWVTRWAHLIAPGGTVLDLACGSGRHLLWLADRGHRVTGVDRDAAAVAPLAARAEIVLADIEAGPWPLEGRRFDAVVVTNYLWRALLPRIVAALAPGGVLIYETFAGGHETIGRPSNPDFLLRPGELLAACAVLRVVAFEEGYEAVPERFVQRIVALREAAPVAGEGAPAKIVLSPRRVSP